MNNINPINVNTIQNPNQKPGTTTWNGKAISFAVGGAALLVAAVALVVFSSGLVIPVALLAPGG
ncbi:MAG TPA: hypothetical protein VJ044_08530, partial [Candidatus Hodarchaeales archaeon]|nr:hypothetical protein [Candidatus Hodarchaeales archaeon]